MKVSAVQALSLLLCLQKLASFLCLKEDESVLLVVLMRRMTIDIVDGKLYVRSPIDLFLRLLLAFSAH